MFVVYEQLFLFFFLFSPTPPLQDGITRWLPTLWAYLQKMAVLWKIPPQCPQILLSQDSTFFCHIPPPASAPYIHIPLHLKTTNRRHYLLWTWYLRQNGFLQCTVLTWQLCAVEFTLYPSIYFYSYTTLKPFTRHQQFFSALGHIQHFLIHPQFYLSLCCTLQHGKLFTFAGLEDLLPPFSVSISAPNSMLLLLLVELSCASLVSSCWQVVAGLFDSSLTLHSSPMSRLLFHSFISSKTQSLDNVFHTRCNSKFS